MENNNVASDKHAVNKNEETEGSDNNNSVEINENTKESENDKKQRENDRGSIAKDNLSDELNADTNSTVKAITNDNQGIQKPKRTKSKKIKNSVNVNADENSNKNDSGRESG